MAIFYTKECFCQNNYYFSMICIYVADNFWHFGESIEEYIKRLGNTVEFIRMKPTKIGDPEQIRSDETQRICDILKKRKLSCFLLDETGKQQTTMEFAAKLRTERDLGKQIAFVVGWAYGVNKRVLAPYVTSIFWLSCFTLPHSLALLVLSEQIYRVHEIWKGSKYHHV